MPATSDKATVLKFERPKPAQRSSKPKDNASLLEALRDCFDAFTQPSNGRSHTGNLNSKGRVPAFAAYGKTVCWKEDGSYQLPNLTSSPA